MTETDKLIERLAVIAPSDIVTLDDAKAIQAVLSTLQEQQAELGRETARADSGWHDALLYKVLSEEIEATIERYREAVDEVGKERDQWERAAQASHRQEDLAWDQVERVREALKSYDEYPDLEHLIDTIQATLS